MDEENDIAAAIEDGAQVLETLCAQEQGKGDAASPLPKPAPEPDKSRANLREHQRCLVNWRAAIIHDGAKGKSTFYGRAYDISIGGVSVYCDHNILFKETVILLLALPPLTAGLKEQILEIRCQIIYCHLTRQSFRVGLKFLGFKDGEMKLLETRINNRGGL